VPNAVVERPEIHASVLPSASLRRNGLFRDGQKHRSLGNRERASAKDFGFALADLSLPASECFGTGERLGHCSARSFHYDGKFAGSSFPSVRLCQGRSRSCRLGATIAPLVDMTA
jgi:hypothetical protein